MLAWAGAVGVQGRAGRGVVAQQEDSIPSCVSTTFSSPQSHLENKQKTLGAGKVYMVSAQLW